MDLVKCRVVVVCYSNSKMKLSLMSALQARVSRCVTLGESAFVPITYRDHYL
jgi:hypothetical protein